MRNRSLIFGTLALATALGTAAVYAHQSAEGRSHRMRHSVGMTFPLFLRGVDLTENQKGQIKELLTSHRAAVRELATQLQTIQNDIETKLLSNASLEEADLTPQIQELSQLRNHLAEENLKISLEIRKLLTPEQLAQAAQHREQMHARWAEKREHFRHQRSEHTNQ